MDLTGNYILTRGAEDRGPWMVLREKKTQNKVYEIVIPDAGWNKEFAMTLIWMLNSQGSEVGNVGNTQEA